MVAVDDFIDLVLVHNHTSTFLSVEVIGLTIPFWTEFKMFGPVESHFLVGMTLAEGFRVPLGECVHNKL